MKQDLKIKKLKSKKLPNIFNSQNILLLQTTEKLSDKKLKFIQEVLGNNCTLLGHEKIYRNS